MRVPISMMIMTLVIFLIGFITFRAEGGPKSMTDVIFEGVELSEPRQIDLSKTSGTDLESIVDIENLWEKDNKDTELWVRFVRGILRSRQKEKINRTKYIEWYRCGKRVQEEDYYILATEWALTLIDAIDQVEEETGYRANPWGAFAMTANEGGFNECTLDFVSRRWAAQHVAKEWTIETWKGKTAGRWVEKPVVKRFQLTYDKETVWRIINHKDYEKATVQIKNKHGVLKRYNIRGKFDGGPFQLRFKAKKIPRDKFDQLLTIRPGLYLGIREMARRAIEWQKNKRADFPHPRVWQLWPGYNSARISNQYDRKITSVAQWLGARREEIWKPKRRETKHGISFE